MSFLNSVLSSIGGEGPRPSIITPPTAPIAKAVNTIIKPTTNRRNDGISRPSQLVAQNNKRKAEDSLAGPNGKIVRNGTNGNQVSRPTLPPKVQSSSAVPTSGSKLATNSSIPYRGTSRPNPLPDSSAVAPTGSGVPAVEATKAPKKNSYAEIMARAKLTQAKPPTVGTISHKPKEKPALSYKQELKLKKKALRDKKLGIKNGSRPGSSGSLSSSSPAPGLTTKKKTPQPAYQGTAKPKPQPTYKGTMKPATSTAAGTVSGPSRNGRPPHKPRYDEYAATDEDDLDDVDGEEDDDYGSDQSDDMEAGFSDVQQEESAATKAAKKEDEEEAKLEARLKSEKEERKRRLEALSKKAKPQRY